MGSAMSTIASTLVSTIAHMTTTVLRPIDVILGLVVWLTIDRAYHMICPPVASCHCRLRTVDNIEYWIIIVNNIKYAAERYHKPDRYTYWISHTDHRVPNAFISSDDYHDFLEESRTAYLERIGVYQ